ncbi:MAG: hypothetical protein WC247_14245 [Porticoccaceae bacterium]
MSTAVTTLLALALTGAAAITAYLTAPRQQWLPRPWPTRPTRAVALALGMAALALWLHLLEVSTAVFTLFTLTMAVFVALPFLAVLRVIVRRPR